MLPSRTRFNIATGLTHLAAIGTQRDSYYSARELQSAWKRCLQSSAPWRSWSAALSRSTSWPAVIDRARILELRDTGQWWRQIAGGFKATWGFQFLFYDPTKRPLSQLPPVNPIETQLECISINTNAKISITFMSRGHAPSSDKSDEGWRAPDRI